VGKKGITWRQRENVRGQGRLYCEAEKVSKAIVMIKPTGERPAACSKHVVI